MPCRQVKKSEVVAQAKKDGVPFVETSYNRIMKELCRNTAGTWTLRMGREDK